ncbi:hypothetical protein DPE81_16150 [Salmonella enterica subsp. enterica]|nr:hypothetical protein [Salmonella enterica]EBU7938328.1 hypothetical protein [Salmonella enterica subsp. enterica serovar Chittagong]EBX6015942.1 hypothetical protein [Salmonella enterica subsp. enterica serovar Dortmund]EBY5127865.1 hypothetical protein [Salmonella enterica subsp. enterica serovar Brazzaville]ECE0504223.1 hypothetical protein [Salmonella enterica subsp. enterica]
MVVPRFFCRMAASTPYPAYGCACVVGRISEAPSGIVTLTTFPHRIAFFGKCQRSFERIF